jgi:hypothetical protein
VTHSRLDESTIPLFDVLYPLLDFRNVGRIGGERDYRFHTDTHSNIVIQTRDINIQTPKILLKKVSPLNCLESILTLSVPKSFHHCHIGFGELIEDVELHDVLKVLPMGLEKEIDKTASSVASSIIPAVQ